MILLPVHDLERDREPLRERDLDLDLSREGLLWLDLRTGEYVGEALLLRGERLLLRLALGDLERERPLLDEPPPLPPASSFTRTYDVSP